jgi:RIO kinase 1
MSYRARVDKKIGRREKRYETERLMREKRSEEYEVLEEVFDRSTLMTIYDFLNKGTIDQIFGSVKAGKESKLYWGKDKSGNPVAIKIFLTLSAEFKRGGMIPYIEGDPRFAHIKRDTRSLVYAWAQKEFKNLMQATQAGVRVPKPIDVSHNVLIMEFIGENGESAPLLREIEVKNPERLYNQVLANLKRLYQKAKLVHGDLSEYNIMIWKNQPVLFDVSQAVPLEHPMATQLLRRDIENLNRYFKRLGVEVLSSEEVHRRIMSSGKS